MNFWLFMCAIVFWLIGWWKIPSTLTEARSPLAPYRAIGGVIWLVIGFVFWFAAKGGRIVFLGLVP